MEGVDLAVGTHGLAEAEGLVEEGRELPAGVEGVVDEGVGGVGRVLEVAVVLAEIDDGAEIVERAGERHGEDADQIVDHVAGARVEALVGEAVEEAERGAAPGVRLVRAGLSR